MRNDVDIGACRGMIKIRIVAVGKVKEKYFSEAIAEYSKRLSRFCDFSIVEVKEENYDKATPAAIEKILSAEGERIEKSIKGLPQSRGRKFLPKSLRSSSKTKRTAERAK